MDALGQHRLMLSVWVKAALAANDRLKVYLTILQTAAVHLAHPKRDLPDLDQDLAAAGLSVPWIRDFAAAATRVDDHLVAPDMPRLIKCLSDDLTLMARPVLQALALHAAPRLRVKHWLETLGALTSDRLGGQQLELLTRGSRDGSDTLDGNDGGVYAGAAQTEMHYSDDLQARLALLRQGGAAEVLLAPCGT